MSRSWDGGQHSARGRRAWFDPRPGEAQPQPPLRLTRLGRAVLLLLVLVLAAAFSFLVSDLASRTGHCDLTTHQPCTTKSIERP